MPDGTYFLNEDIILTLNVPQNYIDTQVNEQLKEIERRLIGFRGSKEYDRELKGKTVVLDDDGIATGPTKICVLLFQCKSFNILLMYSGPYSSIEQKKCHDR
jgi:putative phosphoribosyl transferase